MTGGQITNEQRAHWALEAVSAFARARHQPPGTITRGRAGRDPANGGDRLSRLLCDLRHHADQVPGLSFHDALSAARQEYSRQRASASPVSAAWAAAAGHAAGVYETNSKSPRQSHRPLTAAADLGQHASRHATGLGAAAAGLTTALITGLRHYADRQHLGFEAALAASGRAYTQQRLAQEGPFGTGQEPHRRPSTVLTPAVDAPPFLPIATHQGIVTSFEDAEWHLVRTAARIQDREQRGLDNAYPPDVDDQGVLSDALGTMCGLSRPEVLGRLGSQIATRASETERGPAAAAALGRAHGRSGTQPYCALGMDGDDALLMQALGETEWTTGANHPHRQALAAAYAEAYEQASGRASAMSPARLADRDFPPQPNASQRAAAPAPDPARTSARAATGTRPGPGHRGRTS